MTLRADLAALVLHRDLDLGRGTGGLFIAFEGGEGAGKSTQARLLSDSLTARGYDVVRTFEPGATNVGGRLREVLLDRASTGMPARTEAMLYAADRALHVAQVIRPALERGAIVITDRYVDSSIAYQVGGRGLDDHEVRRLSRWATGGLMPDLTVLLDLAPATGLARGTDPADRLESEDLAFHDRVRATFQELARRGRNRYLVLDVTSTGAEEVHRRVMDRVEPELPDLMAKPATLTMPLTALSEQAAQK